MPWSGVDPIVVSSQIIMALQTITSRQIDPTTAPAIVTIGSIHGGVRNNMIPDEVQMLGTIRTLDPKVQQDIHERIRKLVSGIAESAGATATTTITPSTPVTFNDPQLMDRMLPTVRRVVGDRNVAGVPASTIAEDFAFYQQQVPGMYIFLGVTPVGKDTSTAALNHSPLFTVDEAALSVGIRTLSNLALDFLSLGK
jgi:amidohydrolase